MAWARVLPIISLTRRALLPLNIKLLKQFTDNHLVGDKLAGRLTTYLTILQSISRLKVMVRLIDPRVIDLTIPRLGGHGHGGGGTYVEALVSVPMFCVSRSDMLGPVVETMGTGFCFPSGLIFAKRLLLRHKCVVVAGSLVRYH